jgi:hypothetical protein
MGLLLFRAKATVTGTPGTSTVSLSTAVSPFNAWAASGAISGQPYSYLIEEGSAWESGTGIYTAGSPDTLTRPGPTADPTFKSSNSGALVSFTSAATVACIDNVYNFPARHPDQHPVQPNIADDEFDYGTGLDTTGARATGATAWTWLTTAGTVVMRDGSIVVTPPNGAFRAFDQPVAGATFKYRMKMSFMQPADAATGRQSFQGIYFRRSAACLLWIRGHNGTGYQWERQRWTNLTTPTWSSTPFTASFDADAYGTIRQHAYAELEYDGTNVITRHSGTGYTEAMRTPGSEAAATFLGGAPTHVGVVCGLFTYAVTAYFGFDWFRKVA